MKKSLSIKSRVILEAAPNAFVITNADRDILLVNTQTEKLFGYHRRELIGQKVEILIPERLRAHHPTYFAEYVKAPSVRALGTGRDLFGLKKGGTEVPVEIGLNPLYTKDGFFVLASIIDITERKNEQKRIEQIKNEFISTVSHELRTPLTSILGSLGLISGEKFGAIPEKVKQLVHIALSNCERLIKLINDILDIEKIELGTMDFKMQPTDLSKILRSAVASNEGYAAQYEVKLELAKTISAMVNIDSDRIGEVLANLISNAIKFSPKEGKVLISMLRKNRKIRVMVKDEGPGIPDAFKNKIFSKFAQADSSDRRQKGGTGLGLSICKTIVEKHNGFIGFDSSLEAGTIFYFDLPLISLSNRIKLLWKTQFLTMINKGFSNT